MDVHIGQLTSTVQATDSDLLEQLVERAAARVREQLAYEQRSAEERQIWASVSQTGGHA
jgi:hypothetical protein